MRRARATVMEPALRQFYDAAGLRCQLVLLVSLSAFIALRAMLSARPDAKESGKDASNWKNLCAKPLDPSSNKAQQFGSWGGMSGTRSLSRKARTLAYLQYRGLFARNFFSALRPVPRPASPSRRGRSSLLVSDRTIARCRQSAS
jgi:hypothetical protein